MLDKSKYYGAEFEGKYVQYNVWATGENIDGIVYWDEDGYEGSAFYVKAIGTWRDYLDDIKITSEIPVEYVDGLEVKDFADIANAFTLKPWWGKDGEQMNNIERSSERPECDSMSIGCTKDTDSFAFINR